MVEMLTLRIENVWREHFKKYCCYALPRTNDFLGIISSINGFFLQKLTKKKLNKKLTETSVLQH